MRVDEDCGYSSMAKTRDFRVGIIYEKRAGDKRFDDVKKIEGEDEKPVNAKDIVFKKFPLSVFK